MARELLQLSGLQHFAYCPRQWALIHIEQQWQENERTADGRIFHGRAHDGASHELRGDLLILRFSADGFLYNMVRILAGTLLDVGQGRITAEDVIRITEAHDRAMAGMTMPACGLYLNRVIYREEDKHK